MTNAVALSEAQLGVVEWAAKECTRQASGEASVWWMVRAWSYAMLGYKDGAPITEEVILLLGSLVEPRTNTANAHYRLGQVWVGRDKKPPPERVPKLMEALVAAIDVLDPDEWFREFEEIHPLRDGNGRTGSILWNWLCGSLASPADAPDFWDMPVREGMW